MTQRTDNPQKSPIEAATVEVVIHLNDAISHAHQSNQLPVPEQIFRRIIAGYFERQSMVDWCQLLGIEPTADDVQASRGHA